MPALTLREAAAELRISYGRLRQIVKRHPFYYPNGNRKLFTEDNLSSIRSALLEEKLSNEPRYRTTVQALPSGATALKKALALFAESKKSTKSRRNKRLSRSMREEVSHK